MAFKEIRQFIKTFAPGNIKQHEDTLEVAKINDNFRSMDSLLARIGKENERWNNGYAADLNSATKSGLYYFTPDTLNLPVLDWGTCFVFVGAGADYTGGQYLNQIATSVQYNRIYFRQKTGGSSFTPWREFATAPGIYRLLWQGAWSGGTITVPDLTKYMLYTAKFAGSGWTVLLIRGTGYVTGGTLTRMGGPGAYHFTAAQAGDQLTLDGTAYVAHLASSVHGAESPLTVTEIYGVM